jgi:hypothetical protein
MHGPGYGRGRTLSAMSDYALTQLPRWCSESIIEGAVRSGRSPGSLVVWALAWSLSMAVCVGLVSAFGFLTGLSGPTTLLGFLAPFAIGGIIGSRTPGLGGFGVGFVGLVIGAIVGTLAWVVSVLAGAFGDPSTHGSPGENLVIILAGAMLVPTLTGAQLGIGVLVATVVGNRRWASGGGHRR